MSTQTTRTQDGSMLPTPMLCSIDDSISTSCTLFGERRRVALLRLDQIHHRLGQRAVVADAAGEHELDALLHALVHDARLQHAALDGGADAAGAVDGVDRRHVIAVALLDRRAGHQIDAERRARQRELDVVHGQRVPGEDDVHVALADQRREVLDAAGVDDDRPGDDGDAAAGRLDVAHHLRDARHAAFDATLGRDVVAHEREAETVALAELRRHADAGVAAHDRLAGLDVPQLAAGGGLSVDDDHRVHALLVDLDPAARPAARACGDWSSSRSRRGRSDPSPPA